MKEPYFEEISDDEIAVVSGGATQVPHLDVVISMT